MPEKLTISENGEFCDPDGNVVLLRGVNLDPSVKIPSSPFISTHGPLKDNSFFERADNVSFIGHPLPLDDVREHINRIRSLGFNTVRLPFTWESIEHEGPGKYDFEYMDYFIEMLKIIDEIGGMYVYIDPHQDVWSRFSGGSGAPYWTLLCAGFQPSRFKNNEAAILHNHYINPTDGKEHEGSYPKMVWATNYYRLAAQTMFTLFFAGKEFAPLCKVNGVNIQDYLQDTFLEAVITFYQRIQDKAPELFEHNCIIGLESMNEPNPGYLGLQDLDALEKERDLRLGTTPTAFQSFMLGEGISTTVDLYEISVFGPSKSGTKTIDCKGQNAWLTAEEREIADSKYGWKRNQEWIPSTCIWKLHGVWESDNNGGRLLIPDYFSKIIEIGSTIDEDYFINNFFTFYFNKLHRRFREIDSESFIFIQPPVFKAPPKLENIETIKNKTICACHFYDGLSLMFKTWNKLFNVDTFGVVRGKYASPIFSIVLGESSIRKSIRKQLKAMKNEVTEIMGKSIPVFFTEIGMPFDMDDKRAFKEGNYLSQTKAMDAIAYALEGNNLSFSLWCYCSSNSHKWGDNWNNEDFSIWSPEDSKEVIPVETSTGTSTPSIKSSSGVSDFVTVKEFDDLPFPPSPPLDMIDLGGFRALDALLRPFPVKIHGNFRYAEFDLESKAYYLKIHAKASSNSQIATKNATYIFLPIYQFPLNQLSIKTSSGTFTYNKEYQILKWHHDAGKQDITISLKSDRPESSSSDCVIC